MHKFQNHMIYRQNDLTDLKLTPDWSITAEKIDDKTVCLGWIEIFQYKTRTNKTNWY